MLHSLQPQKAAQRLTGERPRNLYEPQDRLQQSDLKQQQLQALISNLAHNIIGWSKQENTFMQMKSSVGLILVEARTENSFM